MTKPCSQKRLIALVLTLMVSLVPSDAYAAEQDATFELHPHCRVNEAKEDEWLFGPIPAPGIVVETRDGSVKCTDFEILDPQTLHTRALSVGDILDIDVVVDNPGRQNLRTVRATLSYDSSMLQGELLEINEKFSLVTPDEHDFFPEEGYAKMEASSEGKGPDTKKVVFARLQFRVLQTNPIGTPITFHDVQPTGHSAIFAVAGDDEEYIVKEEPGVLLVMFQGSEVTSLDPEQEPEPELPVDENPFGQEEEEPAEPDNSCLRDEDCLDGVVANLTGDRTAFSLLQIRNLRVTTDGSAVFLAWDHLRSSQLKAYNVYYGSTSGKYINRRTINKNENSVTLRSLPLDKRYFFAVRGLSTEDEESAFSQEVSIKIGDPNSSTAPLAAGMITDAPIGNPVQNVSGTFPGETGTPSTIALFVILAAVIGTSFALRRQMIASTDIPHE